MVYSDIHSSQFGNSGSSVLEISLMESFQYVLHYWSKRLDLDRRHVFSSLRVHLIFSWTVISLAYTRTELCGFIHPHSPVSPNIFLSSMVSVPSTLSVCITSKPAFSAGQAPHRMTYRDFPTHNLVELGAGPATAQSSPYYSSREIFPASFDKERYFALTQNLGDLILNLNLFSPSTTAIKAFGSFLPCRDQMCGNFHGIQM